MEDNSDDLRMQLAFAADRINDVCRGLFIDEVKNPYRNLELGKKIREVFETLNQKNLGSLKPLDDR